MIFHVMSTGSLVPYGIHMQYIIIVHCLQVTFLDTLILAPYGAPVVVGNMIKHPTAFCSHKYICARAGRERAARLLEDENMIKRRRFSLQKRFNVKIKKRGCLETCSKGEDSACDTI